MPIEAGGYNEQEKKRKKMDDKAEESKQNKKNLEQQRVKEYVKTEIEAEDDLHSLMDLVKKGVLTKEHAEALVQGKNLDEQVIKEIFDKIAEIEEIKDVDNYLSPDLRISKDDYVKAVHDDIFRVQTIIKLDTALTVLSQQIAPASSTGINLFSGFLTLLDKNLVKIQEHTIDIKGSLTEIHDQKFPRPKLSIWERFVNFLKELIN